MSSSLTVKDILLEEIVTGKSQARAMELEKGLEDLTASMDRWGLLEPITVFLNDDKKYEVLAGQRRFTAAKKLGWKTIPSVIRSKPKDEFEAKAFSLTGNVTSNPMTTQDIMDSCDMLIKRYTSTKMVAKVVGITEHFVKKYVKYARLPDSLKQAVDKGQLGTDTNKAISIALQATDALQYEHDGSVSEEKVLQLSKILAKKIPKERKDIVEEAKKDPEKDLDQIVKKASEPSKTKGRPLELVMDEIQYSRLENYQEKNKNSSPEDAALEIIADGLERSGF